MARNRQAVATSGGQGDLIAPGTTLVQPKFPGEGNVAAITPDTPRKDGPYPSELTDIAQRLGTLAQEQVTAKSVIETRMLEDVRAFHGVYDAKDIASWRAAGQSYAYVKATRAKTLALEARLFDLIHPTDDRNWGITATPVPRLSAQKQEAELRATTAAAQATQETDPAREQQIVAAGNDEAERALVVEEAIASVSQAAEAMQDEMDDQLVESRYPSESRLAIHDMCMLGTGIIKGPMTKQQTRGRWLPDDANVYQLQQQEDDRPLIKRVDPWSFFPDMSAACIEEAEFTFERYLWTRSDLRRMVATHGFDPEAVRELLRERGSREIVATGPSIANLVSLRSITEDVTGTIKNRFIGWEYHGPLECAEVAQIMRSMGREEEAEQYLIEDDPLKEHRVIVWFCDNTILKLAPEYPLDSGETLYSVVNLERAEGSMFGYGVPRVMRDSQDSLNSAWRVALDNAALSVGPQAMIDKTAIAPADGDWTMRPKKIWHRLKAALQSEAKPVEFFNVPNNMAELKTLIELCTIFIDMETGIPQPQQGEQGAHTTQTVGGMAILQNAANIIFRRIVKNVDDQMITPTMRRLYDWNMQFNPRDDIKGDMEVDARGTSVLLLKEVQATNLMVIIGQLWKDPEIRMMLKGFPLVEKLFQTMMIKPAEVMIEEKKYDKLLQDMAAKPPPPNPAQIQAEARIKAAQIQAEASSVNANTGLQVAQLRERTAMLELAISGDISMEELKTRLAETKLKTDSSERQMITEAAIERQAAEEARAAGDEPTGSGGSFSMGDGDGTEK